MNYRLTILSAALFLAATQLPFGAAAQAHVPAGSPDESASQLQAARAASESRARFTDVASWYLAAGAPQRHFRVAYGAADRVLADASQTVSVPQRAADSKSWSAGIDQRAAADLKAASRGIEGATAWMSTEARAATAAAGKDVRTVGATLARDGDRAGKDIVKDFDALRASLQGKGESGGSGKVSPFDVGA